MGSSRLQGLSGLLALEATVEPELPELDRFALPSLDHNTPVLIQLEKIKRSRFQPRSFFNQEKIEKMADKFRQYREQNERPKTIILVRPIPDSDQFELVFGEQRKLAHEKAGYPDILAFVDDTITDEEARELALTENLMREDLNPVEKTEAILDLAAVRIGATTEEVKQLLDKAANERKFGTDNVTRTEQWQMLEAFFQELPDRLTPESFRTNYLPLLKLPIDVLNVLHQGKLEYTKAKAIARIKEENQRQDLLQKAVNKNLSIREIRSEVKARQKLEPTQNQKESRILSIPDRLVELARKMKKNKVWQHPSRSAEIEELLKKLEEVVTNRSSEDN